MIRKKDAEVEDEGWLTSWSDDKNEGIEEQGSKRHI